MKPNYDDPFKYRSRRSAAGAFLNEYRLLITRLLSFFFIFIVAVWGALLLYYQTVSSEVVTRSLAPQVKYWSSVGDAFQLRRSLSNLIEGKSFEAVIVFNAKGQTTFVSPERFPSPLPFPKKRAFVWQGIKLILWDCDFANPSNELEWGAVCVATRPSLGQSLPILLFIAIGLSAFVFYSLSRAKKLAISFVAPLETLRKAIAVNHGKKETLSANDFAFSEVEEVYSAFRSVIRRLEESEAERRKSAQALATAQLAQQVAHDIQSPLAALSSAEQSFSMIPEETRVLIRSAITRIRSISSHLLMKSRTATPEVETSSEENAIKPHLLYAVIDGIVAEKQLQFRVKSEIKIEFHCPPESYRLFASIELTDFKRALSNLINNAVEAIEKEGSVIVSLSEKGETVAITVKDTGCGIPKDHLSRLTQRGETFGKQSGTGLGLFQAKTAIRKWEGELTIHSKLGEGTLITITLPQTQPPSWYAQNLHLARNSKVVVLDDDIAIHQVWKRRFFLAISKKEVALKSFFQVSDFRKFVSAQSSESNIWYLVDYELSGESCTGLELIEQLGIAKQTLLVTSLFEDSEIQAMCLKIGVSLLPKNMAAHVPIVFAG